MTPYPGMQPGPMMGSQNAQQAGTPVYPQQAGMSGQMGGVIGNAMQQPVSGHPMLHPALPGVMGAIHQAMPYAQPMHPAMVGALNDFLHAHQAMQPAPALAGSMNSRPAMGVPMGAMNPTNIAPPQQMPGSMGMEMPSRSPVPGVMANLGGLGGPRFR